MATKNPILLQKKVSQYISNKGYLDLYKCFCGNIFVCLTRSVQIGLTKSCGCLVGKNISHGMSRTGEYRIWGGIISRTCDKNDKYYSRYGGAGIDICKTWLKFENFYADMGIRPSSEHSIDRVDNNKGYSKENCRWATRIQQCNNRKSNRFVEYRNETLTLANLGRKYNVCPKLVRSRLRIGWSIEKAVTHEKR